MNRLEVDGKFFRLDGQRTWIKSVTYGPFPEPQPDPFQEFAEIKAAGFHAVRLYLPPSQAILAAAKHHDVLLFVGMGWQWTRVFLGDGGVRYWHEARIKALQSMQLWGNHPNVAAVYIANEIAPDISRWQGYENTRKALDELITSLREKFPHLLFAYSSFPTSEYLEPATADFTAINVYLENKEDLNKYLQHLQHVAGDRPVMISEFGLDSLRNGEHRQASTLQWQLAIMRASGTAGATIFSWSDRWQNGQTLVEDWDFGMKRRDGTAKPALEAVSKEILLPTLSSFPMISVIICVHNGAARVEPLLKVADQLNYPSYEVLIIDDGSKDQLAKLCQSYPAVRYHRQVHSGLSAARNLGAKQAKGEIFAYTDDDCVPDEDWLYWIAKSYEELDCDLCGGPNLPPIPLDEDEAIVAAAPGAPSHVMFTDTKAEHIPGCNLTVRREAFEKIGGFNERYWFAGDDVDFCWRAEDKNLHIGFHGAAFVWHRRRATLYNYFKQQRGYGKAEALLLEEHPQRFNEKGEAEWNGVIYQGGASSVERQHTIYSGPMGTAPFQSIHCSVMPSRPLHRKFTSKAASRKLRFAKYFLPLLRKLTRISYGKYPNKWRTYIRTTATHLRRAKSPESSSSREQLYRFTSHEELEHFKSQFISEGWTPLENDPEWDLEREEQVALLCTENLGGGAWHLRVRLSQKRKN